MNYDNIIEKIAQATYEIGFDQISNGSVGDLLSTLVATKDNATILELGTGTGLGTAHIMRGMTKTSTLITVEIESSLVEVAKRYLAKDARVTFHTAPGEEVINSILHGSIDIIFADTWPGKYYYLDETLLLLKSGGMYIIDDMLPQDNWPDGHAEKADTLRKYLKDRRDLQVVDMSWATGVMICVKIDTEYQETNKWNPEEYGKHTGFVSELALPVVDLLSPQRGEKILDAGCGDGTLALEMTSRGANVIGVDMSPEMIEVCTSRGVEAYVGSVTELEYVDEFDAVFSNATLHWVLDAREAVQNIAKSLKSGGRFICEFGGEGNVHELVSAMREVFDNHDDFGVFENPWYFPSVDEYRNLLESEGFVVEYIELIPRPTPMDDIKDWLNIFTNGVTAKLSAAQREVFVGECEKILYPVLHRKSGWSVDYVRLRVKAIKQ